MFGGLKGSRKGETCGVTIYLCVYDRREVFGLDGILIREKKARNIRYCDLAIGFIRHESIVYSFAQPEFLADVHLLIVVLTT